MRCCPGSSSGPINCCCGWRIRSYATNGLAFPTRDAAPPAIQAGWDHHPEAVVVVLGTGREFNTCREASELPAENLPRVVISPQGYPASAPTAEENQEVRRTLSHWPDNVALALDWHY